MPRFTIDLTQKAVDRLQAHVQRTNDANGTSLTLREWLELHANEIAISDELAAAIQAIQEQQQQAAQDTLQAAIRVKRDELLANLEVIP